jgi:two-component system sensor histidine kinase KdpD
MSVKKENACVLVCINEHPKSRALLYAGARKARDEKLPWMILYVEEPSYYQLSPEAREHILKCLTRAEEMGAEIIRLQAPNVDQAITSYVKSSHQGSQPVRHIIIGSPERRRWMPRLFTSHATGISSRLSTICEVHVVPLKGEYDGRNWLAVLGIERVELKEIFFSLLSVGIAMLAAESLKMMIQDYIFLLQPQNIALIFLIAVVFVGGRWGLIPALIAAFTSHFIINYFYVKPYLYFTLSQATDVINLVLFLVAAIMVALFSSHTRAYAQSAVKREKRTQALYQLQRLTSENHSHFEALKTMHDALRNLLEMEVAFFCTPPEGHDAPVPEYPLEVELDDASREALRLCWRDAITTGMGGPYSRGVEWRFEPMFSTSDLIGVIGVKVPLLLSIDSSFGRLLSAVSDQCASILQRIALTRRMEDAKISEEKEKLRSLLLSAVSHDLKTPLSSIIGSLSVYHSMFDKLSDEHKLTLTVTALDEAQRLDSFISNILDMTRLESGHVKFKFDWHDPVALFKRVNKRMRNRLRERELHYEPPSKHMEVWVDGVMTEQLLQNLIDNAIKYSPSGTPIEVEMEALKNTFCIRVRDHGKGVPQEMRLRIFDKYERLQKEDSQVAGTGLGLAICKSIVEQMHGEISINNHEDGGAVFEIVLPKARVLKNQPEKV